MAKDLLHNNLDVENVVKFISDINVTAKDLTYQPLISFPSSLKTYKSCHFNINNQIIIYISRFSIVKYRITFVRVTLITSIISFPTGIPSSVQ
jgi:hypothetical protein